MARKKDPVLQLPSAVAEEIGDVARRAQRSVAFIVARTLSAGKGAAPAAITGPTSPLALTCDEEDPPNLLTKLPTSEAVAGAWPLAREKFHAWLARLEEAAQAERADDLDNELREAADAETPPARLGELAKSEYPKVRALVAAHRATPAEVLALLANDRERSVREAVSARA